MCFVKLTLIMLYNVMGKLPLFTEYEEAKIVEHNYIKYGTYWL